MELVGFNDLQGRSTYQPLIINQNGREIAYMGHHAGHMLNPLTGNDEPNGTSLLDVTNPKHPRYLHHIIGPTGGGGEAGGAQMVRVCSGSLLPSGTPGHWYMLRNFGSGAHQVWDTTDPTHPTLVATIGNQTATHKNWWECDTGIAYLVGNSPTNAPGWHHSGSQQHVEIYDLSNPASPKYIRDYGLPGQQPDADTSGPCTPPNCVGIVNPPPGIHGPISAGAGKNRIYMPYGVGSNGVIQIVDRLKLLNGCNKNGAGSNPNASANCSTNPTAADLLWPQVGTLTMSPDQGGHSSFPVYGVPIPEFQDFTNLKTRDLLLVASEAGGNECQGEGPHMDFIFDISHESTPYPIASLRVPEFPGDFCRKGGRFGSHSVTETIFPPYYGKLLIGSWFTAGVRVFDIRDPFDPQPIAYFIPAPDRFTFQNCATLPGGVQDCKTVIQTNNAEVDDRGLIYIADRAGSGLHILRLTGRAREVVFGHEDDDDRDHDHDH